MSPRTNTDAGATGFRAQVSVMSISRREESYFGLTMIAAALTFGFYPLTLAPVGAWTNGRVLGLASVTLALVVSWAAFSLNRSNPVLRMFFQLPITALVTFIAIREAIIQFLMGPENWLWL